MAFRYDQPRKRHRLTTRMIGIALLVVGAGAGACLGVDIARERASAGWPSVVGTLTKANVQSIVSTTSRYDNSVTFDANVEYSYDVNGHPYTGHHYFLSTNRIATSFGAAAATKELTPGKQVPVYYNPADPSLSCLRPEAAPRNIISMALGGVVIGLGVVLAVGGPRIDARRFWGSRP